MASPKGFLLQECENIQRVLEEALRYKYGPAGSQAFFDECTTRLDFIAQQIGACADSDHASLQIHSHLVNQLAELIWRIERSSLGEYSWPFVEQLKKIAEATCTEKTLTAGEAAPLIHVLAHGGLHAYSIFPEPRRPSGGQRRILTIIFPQSLKHFVLLHAILGHEIGHAIWATSRHQHGLANALKAGIMAPGTPFESSDATAQWLFRPDAPQEIKDQLAAVNASQQMVFKNIANWGAWIEELLCDLIGVLTFGPSFVAAEANLLFALNPSGLGLGRDHPPVALRINLLLTASRLLRHDVVVPNLTFSPHIASFWNDLRLRSSADPWLNPLTDQQIKDTLDGISGLLGQHPPAQFIATDSAVLNDLLAQLSKSTPPVGFTLRNGVPECRRTDFRDILYAGWVDSCQTSPRSFYQTNRLCEHGIMQQAAIELA